MGFVVVQSLSHAWLFATPWTAAHQSFLSFTISQSLLKLMSIESVMPSNHLVLCCPLTSCLQSFPASGSFLMSKLFASGGQKYWSFSFSISPSNEYWGLISFRIDWLDLLAVQGTLKSPRWLYKVISPCSTESRSKYVLLWHLVNWRRQGWGGLTS